MLFHTLPFLVFMLIVLPVFFALRRTPLWIPWLLAASYFFYGWWNPYYLLLVLYSTTLEFLSYMGINELTDLPELKEVAPLLEEREHLSEEGEERSSAPANEESEGAEPEVEVSTADGAA